MKDDTISRQTAIEALKICDTNEDGKICHICPMRDERWDGAWEDNETICYKKLMRDSAKLLALPPARQTALTADDIETIRIHLSAFKEELCNQGRWTEATEYEQLIQRLIGKE